MCICCYYYVMIHRDIHFINLVSRVSIDMWLFFLNSYVPHIWISFIENK